jgi:hypothetical protein
VYGADQFGQPGFGTARVAPLRRIDLTLVGIVEFNNQIIQDDVDQRPTNVLYTPALTRSMLAVGAAQGTWYGMQLKHGDADIASVEQALLGLIPHDEIPNFRVAALTDAKVECAIRPESIALGAFGAIAALGITLQSSVRRRRHDLALLKTLGFTRRQLVGTIGCQAAVAGVVGVAVGLALGVAAGRWLWILFARDIHAVAQPVVPGSLILVGTGVLALVLIVAVLPGRAAAHTPAGLTLRAE